MFDVKVADGVATVTMDRPPVNAMSQAWVAALHSLLDELEARDAWSVLHLRSALQVFSAGADLKEMRERFATPEGIEQQLEVIRGYQTLFARIEALPRVTLAEISGTALGGGFEVTLACDLRIAAQEAKVGLPELRLGLLPGAGGTQRMTRLAGRAVALRLILGAEQVDGAEAARLGLVQWAVPATELADAAAAVARRYAALPMHAAQAAKACIAAASSPGADGFNEEVEQSRGLLQTARTRDLVGAFLARSSAR
ncbi:MAG TPA: enoyl-CoA hydratase/isomerase family protein [Acetobacteraceae bacterium]|nr:enoyl-CoA hydratase/isomerase family protein [Acetobacteraceae bacterium]